MSTILAAVQQALTRAADHNPNTHVAPAVVLWPDAERRWEPFIPALRAAYPGLLTLGGHTPAERTGPAIWLRCVLAGTLPEGPPLGDAVPVLYLPGVSRSELRAVDTTPPELQPLAELQYRGVIWSQQSGRDWTPFAFLKSSHGGLGLDLAQDDDTLEALHHALPKLAATPVARLRGRRLEAADFRELIRPESTADLLRWLNDPDSLRAEWAETEWATFRGICRDEYGFDPEADGPSVAAERLGQQQDRWATVWRRYAEAPLRYPRIADRLRQAAPQTIDPQDLFTRVESWPQHNERQEDELRTALVALADETPEAAAKRIEALESTHRERRRWVWAELGHAPLALALEHLATLARLTEGTLTGGTAEALAESYVNDGWQADAAALHALAEAELPADRAAVTTAIRPVYGPWLERVTDRFQKRVLAAPLPSAGTATPGADPEPGEVVIFADGLRYDIARMLLDELRDRGAETEENWRWAALPTVTPTAKPAASPVADQLEGGSDASEFRPMVREKNQPLVIDRFRALLTEQGIQVLRHEETGDPSGRAWAEYGNIDRLGHDEGAGLARRIPEEVRGLALRITTLLGAGWRRVRVVTDHGWLLLPGGLPKVELKGYLAESRWGRCAVLRSTSKTKLPSFAWHWAPEVHVVAPHGIGSFIAGQEYAHGGLSLQECVVPVLTVKGTASTVATAAVEEIRWVGLRCRVRVEASGEGFAVDLRVKPGDPATSIASEAKPLDGEGKAALLVPDDSYEGSAVTLVVLDAAGEVIAREATTVGGG